MDLGLDQKNLGTVGVQVQELPHDGNPVIARILPVPSSRRKVLDIFDKLIGAVDAGIDITALLGEDSSSDSSNRIIDSTDEDEVYESEESYP